MPDPTPSASSVKIHFHISDFDTYASLAILSARLPYVDYLQPMRDELGAIYIPRQRSHETIEWTAYLKPFSVELWIAILIKSIIFTFCAYVMESVHVNYNSVSYL